MIWYCKKLYFPQISFFSLFSPLDFLPHLQTLWFFPPPPPGGGKTQEYTGLLNDGGESPMVTTGDHIDNNGDVDGFYL